MRVFALLPFATGCAGTVFTQVETGYHYAPVKPGEHGGSITGHIGGSDIPFLGIGMSARTRAMSNAWVFPEIGPHAFFFAETDAPVAFYVRANTFVGLAGVNGGVRPMFSVALSPGMMIYPGDSPLGLTISLIGEGNLGPGTQNDTYTRGWAGLQVGFGIGGVKE
ncbi:MAG: hypothetical protein H6737_23600 [Alphaproteobacteria bacterium]|nr:hypothetical protein [Alphaproteobacteria bacterium]